MTKLHPLFLNNSESDVIYVSVFIAPSLLTTSSLSCSINLVKSPVNHRADILRQTTIHTHIHSYNIQI